jgi:demethylmenaquinone methyltransferase/2-methoxy-6-polyprenyl-1,4-benzoquinol methylase
MSTADEGKAWKLSGSQKREAVRSLFDDIATRYDVLNSAMSLRLHHRWRTEAVNMLELSKGSSVADICCGTGDFAPPIRRAVGAGSTVVGIDFSSQMLKIARDKRVDMSLGLGDACALPLASGTFDAVTIGWGLRNVSELDTALMEVRRVLKPQGRFVSVDMAKPRNAFLRRASGITFSVLAPAVGAVFGNRDAYRYLPKSTETFASREELAAAMKRAGFQEVGYKDMFLGNICIHWGQV